MENLLKFFAELIGAVMALIKYLSKMLVSVVGIIALIPIVGIIVFMCPLWLPFLLAYKRMSLLSPATKKKSGFDFMSFVKEGLNKVNK